MLYARNVLLILRRKMMKISMNFTLGKILAALGWTAVGLILVATTLFTLSLLNSSDQSGAGMIIYFILLLMGQFYALAIIPMVVIGLGVARDMKAGKSVLFSVFRWFLAGIAAYIVAMIVLLNILVRMH
jgi:hypothetical protein